MGVYQSILNMDAYYRITEGDKIILNDLKHFSIDDLETVNRSLMTVYDGDVFSTLPTCDCGYFKKRHRLNRICPQCGTRVKDPSENVKPLLWLKRLDGYEKMMNPEIWLQLKIILAKNIDAVRWMVDTSYRPPVDIPIFLTGVIDVLGERTYSNLVNRFEKVLIYFINHSKFKKTNKQKQLEKLLWLYKKSKKDIYTNYLPIVNKKLFVMENTTKGKFTNLSVSDVIDLVLTWIRKCGEDGMTERKMSNLYGMALSKLANLDYNYFRKYTNGKPAIFRKHIYGARSHFTFRNVITSIPGKHKYNEIYIPFSIGVTAFRPHVLNKLTKLGYSYKDASKKVFKAVKVWDAEIAKILDILIEKSPYMGIPVLLQRNPSLLQGSAQRVFITKFKKDITDYTISMSGLIVKAPNADFDGDEVNITILHDHLLAEEFSNFDPHFNIPNLSKPYTISSNLTLLGPATSILNNYLDRNLNKDNKPDKLADLLEYEEV